MNLDLKTAFRFLLYVLISVITVYYLPSFVGGIWLAVTLIMYWYSKDEPFWLVFFIVLSDGFMSFFGPYQALVSVFPGMPALEAGQIYIILSVLKARQVKSAYPVFYKKWLYVMGVYVLLLIFLGLAIGIKGEMNAYFRILKQTFPLLLFFSIPRLFRNRDDYMRVFALIFPVALFASAAQLYEIITQEPISAVLGAKEFVEEDLADDEASRSFYNTCVTLLSMFASLFYASYRGNKFNSIYLSFLTMAALSMAFLSATRGWIIAFGVTLILSVIFVTGFKLGRLLVFFGVGLLALILVMSVPVLKSQMTKATERFLTVESITEGDVTAGDTQIRTTIRGPRVMKKWSESPVLGYGFSDERRAYDDVHVGNQNILLHSGIIGLTLILAFFAYFMFEMFQTSMQKSDKSLLVFIFFFIGFFFIHSTSGQMFGYSLIPRYAFTPAVFCSFGAFIIAEIKGLNYSNTGE